MKFCNYMNSDWFASLQREVVASNITQVALKIGCNRSTVSAIVNGLSEYATGKASTAKFERAFRLAYEQMTCPHTSQAVGIDYCRDHALAGAPTHNPRLMMHWQTCQQCPNKPKPVQPPAKPVKSSRINPAEPVATIQQAGIIDTVTLPLPEVGAPQIAIPLIKEAA